MLEDRTLVQHCDSDELGKLAPRDDPNPIDTINNEVRNHLRTGDLRPLIEMMTSRGVFRRNPHRLEAWLERTNARRVVHGHTPHRCKHPDIYANGRAIDFDGGMGRYGRPGAFRGGSPKGSVAPLPP
jgi:hypothetical protein